MLDSLSRPGYSYGMGPEDGVDAPSQKPAGLQGAAVLALVILVFAAAEVAAWYMPNTWIKRDGRFYTNVNTTIVEDFSLDQHRFAASWYDGKLGWNHRLDPGWSNIALGRNGEYWPKHPYLMPVLSTPLFFAFGLAGTLLFNLLVLGLAAGAGYLFVREGASCGSVAGLAVLTLLLTPAVREYTYDYHVDILLLGLWLTGLAAIATGRGALAGVMVGLTVVLRPTCLVWTPCLILLLVERRDLAGLRRALIGGAVVLAVWALLNTWMFGRPWWTGYNRTLVVVNGLQQVFSHTDSFTVPFLDGLGRIFTGHWGLVNRFTILALGLPGLLLLARRRPLYCVAAVLGMLISLALFACYRYEGDRFHWPAIVLLLPALAASLSMLAKGVRRLHSRVELEDLGAPLVAAFLAVAAVCARLPFGPTIQQRLSQNAYHADTLLGAAGLVVLQLLALGTAVFFVTRLMARLAGQRTAAVMALGATLLPVFRADLLAAGPSLLAAALALCALDLALNHRFAPAGACAVLSAWVAGAPWLTAVAVLGLAAWQGKRACVRFAIAAGPVLVAWVLWQLIFGFSSASWAGSLAGLADGLGTPGPARALLPLIALAPLGLFAAWRKDRRLTLALLVLALSLALPGVAGDRGRPGWPILGILLLVIPVAPLIGWISSGLPTLARLLRGRRALAACAMLLAVLAAIGTTRRVAAGLKPFRIGSQQALRRAVVDLNGIPCDFLAWEHMSWECSHFDRTVFGQMAGLALPEGIRVGGEQRSMLLVPTGRRGRIRRVRWPDLRAGQGLTLAYAVPDGLHGEAEVVVKIDDTVLDRFKVPARTGSRILTREIDTIRFAGRAVTLAIEVRGLHDGRQAAVAFDGGWS